MFSGVHFKIIATGSKGNAYLISEDGIKFLIDPGIAYKDLLRATGFKLSEVAHTLVSHEHKDHCRALPDLRKIGAALSMSRGTADALKIKPGLYHVLTSGRVYDLLGWQIMPFDCVHDAAEPLGFLIKTPGGGKICYATDTGYLPCQFVGVTHWLIECNYSEELLEKNESLHPAVKRRISDTHFSLEGLIEFFKLQDLSKTIQINLIHLSDDNSDPPLFVKKIEALTGKPVYLSDPI